MVDLVRSTICSQRPVILSLTFSYLEAAGDADADRDGDRDGDGAEAEAGAGLNKFHHFHSWLSICILLPASHCRHHWRIVFCPPSV